MSIRYQGSLRHQENARRAFKIAREKLSLNKQKRIEEYNKNPKKCKECNTFFSYENRRKIFCNSSCAATFNNKRRTLSIETKEKIKNKLKGIRNETKNLTHDFSDKICPEYNQTRNKIDEVIIKACENEATMSKASAKVNALTGLSRYTFKIRAKKLNVWKTNQGGKGTIKSLIKLENIFSNEKYLGSQNLRPRLIKEGYKENKCEICGLTKWNHKEIILELDHINGNKMDNRLENLRILCPNCHSQTHGFRGRKRQLKEL